MINALQVKPPSLADKISILKELIKSLDIQELRILIIINSQFKSLIHLRTCDVKNLL